MLTSKSIIGVKTINIVLAKRLFGRNLLIKWVIIRDYYHQLVNPKRKILAILFELKYDPPVGELVKLSKDVSTILAPNASPMTFRGTQTYIIGEGDELAIIDPGPNISAHLQAINKVLRGKKLIAIFVTHSHVDHSPLGQEISDMHNVPIYAFGGTGEGKSEIMKKYTEKSEIGGGEGVDPLFNPDILISTGDYVSCSSWSMEAIHTPGHMSNHLCFSLNQGEALFSGDLVMGWATTLISPPDGDIGQYKASLNSLLKRKENLYYPGHGAPLKNAKKMVLAQLNHRNEREVDILNSISQKGSKINEIVDSVYHDLSDNLKIAASRNVLAHLIHFVEKGLVLVDDDNMSLDSLFKIK